MNVLQVRFTSQVPMIPLSLMAEKEVEVVVVVVVVVVEKEIVQVEVLI
jgi:hypothetical protein